MIKEGEVEIAFDAQMTNYADITSCTDCPCWQIMIMTLPQSCALTDYFPNISWTASCSFIPRAFAPINQNNNCPKKYVHVHPASLLSFPLSSTSLSSFLNVLPHEKPLSDCFFYYKQKQPMLFLFVKLYHISVLTIGLLFIFPPFALVPLRSLIIIF